ncbi:type II toxin-antitoxin system prevent-host-death family antitoxin [Candidatus Parabeggiatoa sp. HSG14]|uniref:type II toxin-antitoxin system Phd/YefM family antitoxin n=1 Tax=Candidatus Parabeggiatoa sp. HSG14 TaxID=3055593 RepID=UPI0025A69711|nr:type II toxin-antitoxin system prevent-host-death family antitoxin [Thiotrichales bacterium HSG14]
MLNISVTEFETHFNQILNRVETGEDITLIRLGEPIIRLSSVKKKLKPLRSLAEFRATLPMAKTPSVEIIRQIRDEGY